MWKIAISSVAFVCAAPAASAQSFNIDFGPPTSPFGSPYPTYGGSANSPGMWTRVSTTSATNLRRWDGTPTIVSLSCSGVNVGCAPMFWSFDHANTSGDDESLLDDGYSCDEVLMHFDFQNLEHGAYTVDTIMVGSGCHGQFVTVGVTGSPDPYEYVRPFWNGAFVEGPPTCCTAGNFARQNVDVTDGTLRIDVVWEGKAAEYIHVVGIQLDKHEPGFVGSFLCQGDGTAGACPCANSGQHGFGCQNSAGTGGAFLCATGTTNPDTVVLRASGELPSVLTIFMQDDTGLAPLVYGDGLRCTGGVLKRLYAKSAVAGAIAAPQAGDPSITTRSAALGDPIAPGQTRYYQTFYRDQNPGFCSPPAGANFNTSNAVGIAW